MHRYCYSLYGYQLFSDISLPLRTTQGQEYTGDAEDSFSLQHRGVDQMPLDEDVFVDLDKGFSQIRSPIASYTIDVKNRYLEVSSKSQEEIISTLFNIPFSIISSLRGEVLLHASSIMSAHNSVVAFCGKKAAGKSTLVAHLAKMKPFFGDDTLNIKLMDRRLSCYSAGDFIKMSQETFKSVGLKETLFSCYKKNIQGKAYVDCSSAGLLVSDRSTDLCLSRIYFVSRHNENRIAIQRIECDLQKRAFLVSNIVGVGYLPAKVVEYIANSSVFKSILKTVELYSLKIPHDIANINNVARDVGTLIFD